MNRKMIIYTIGQILGVEGICMILSAGVSLIYREYDSALWLALSGFIGVVSFLLTLFMKPKDKEQTFFAREGIVTVALSWLFLSLVGALPFFLSKQIPSFIDCFFEVSSGLSTTGASILTDVTSLSHGMLFWRSLTHWIGGMGVLVLVLAIAPSASGRSIHMARAEMPGPTVGKLVPKMKDTAKILYIIYLVMTAVQALLLWAGDMDLFESVVHAFGTAGTGGFGIKNDSIASYSAYSQWIITIFMLLFGVNFNLFYFILIRKASLAFKSSELWVYFGLVLSFIIVIAIDIRSLYQGVGETVRASSFTVASLISTTGYGIADINAWPPLSRGIMFVIMFLGGCAGSTAGGLKISRLMLMFKVIKARLKHIIHPKTVCAVKFDGKPVDDDTALGAATYFSVYMICIAVLFIVLTFDPVKFDIETNLSSAVSTFNNVGPAFGGAASGYAPYSWLSKLCMSFAMLLGRLEIYPILITLSPSTWRK